MRKQIALLLILAMMVCMVPGVYAAEADQAQVVLDAGFVDTNVQVTVRLDQADRVTNGRVILTYEPEAEKLLEVRTASGLGAVSVNKEVSGEISVAWVGSHFNKEGAQLFTAVFEPVEEQDLHYEARCTELYAGQKPVSARSARAFVAWNPFTDIDGHWAEDEIIEGWHRGLVHGVTDTLFNPDGTVSRAMFVTVLHRMAGSPAADGNTGFTDVPSGRYYEEAVNWAVELGIAKGNGHGLFKPHNAISRQEMVTMLYRYAKAMNLDVSADEVLDQYRDAANVSDWAEAAMNWAVDQEIICGKSASYLAPRDISTRAQAITVLCRFLNNERGGAR